MAEILGLDTGSVSIPTFTSNLFGGTIAYLLIAFSIFLVIVLVLFLYLNNRKYNIKIIVFENISGNGYQVAFKDRARLIRMGDGGEEILWLKKKKVYRAAYGRKQGKNEYWFAIGQDGYWYNFLLGDLDAKMNMLDIEPIDRDMRYMHVAIRKNIEERFRKETWMQKYGTILINGVFLMIMIIAMWLLIDQIGELIGTSIDTIEASKQALEPAIKALSYADSICSGGTGISPA